ncbi:MAG: methyltransferase domain-containing protein [Chloroflexi bacterium]|nr:methyltransferase domain-containing protein [Chloroflexota bacterium]
MTSHVAVPDVDQDTLRCEISKEYAEVALNPAKGFHFHTGRPLASMLGYKDEWIAQVPEATIASFAGTGNPFSMSVLHRGERVVDVGCGAGIDSLIAGSMVGPSGAVIGVDMTQEMLDKASGSAQTSGAVNVTFKKGYAEALPVSDGWADVVISNGVVNLAPDKAQVFREMFRVLKPGGRLQIGDIIVQKAVPESAKKKIDLWTG